jgi:hypothetical protein
MTANLDFADSSIGKTYRRLRILASAALIGLPLLTAVSAYVIGRHPLEPSLSDYYFVLRDGGLPRTIFVIFLAFLGGVLVSYRGLDEKDNRIHNYAGLFSFGVALFPMQCNTAEHASCVPGLWPLLHLPSAALLYVSALLSVKYGGGPKLRSALSKLANPQSWIDRLDRIRLISAALMTVGIIGFFVHALLPSFLAGFSWVFWIEYSGFFGFGLYWLLLMLLIDAANKEGRSTRAAVPTGPAAERAGPVANAEPWADIP